MIWVPLLLAAAPMLEPEAPDMPRLQPLQRRERRFRRQRAVGRR